MRSFTLAETLLEGSALNRSHILILLTRQASYNRALPKPKKIACEIERLRDKETFLEGHFGRAQLYELWRANISSEIINSDFFQNFKKKSVHFEAVWDLKIDSESSRRQLSSHIGFRLEYKIFLKKSKSLKIVQNRWKMSSESEKARKFSKSLLEIGKILS